MLKIHVSIFYNISLCVWSVAQSCSTLHNPTDCSPPGSSVHGIFQEIILEWVALSYSREPSQPRDQTRISHAFLNWQAGSKPLHHLGSPIMFLDQQDISVTLVIVVQSLQPHGLQLARLSCPSLSLELAQTHVRWIGDAIQPCHPLLLLLPLPSFFPRIRVFSNELALHIRWPKVLELQHQSFQWIFRVYFL